MDSISFVHERLEDANNKDKDLKTKIYHITLKTILQRIYLPCLLLTLRKGDINDVSTI